MARTETISYYQSKYQGPMQLSLGQEADGRRFVTFSNTTKYFSFKADAEVYYACILTTLRELGFQLVDGEVK